MRSRGLIRLFERQDICLLCAARRTLNAPRPRSRFLQDGGRPYNTTTSRRSPSAAAAVAQEEEEVEVRKTIEARGPQGWDVFNTPQYIPPKDDPFNPSRPAERFNFDPGTPIEQQPDWKCDSCGNLNLPIRGACLTCSASRPRWPKLVPPSYAYDLRWGGPSEESRRVKRSGHLVRRVDASRQNDQADTKARQAYGRTSLIRTVVTWGKGGGARDTEFPADVRSPEDFGNRPLRVSKRARAPSPASRPSLPVSNSSSSVGVFGMDELLAAAGNPSSRPSRPVKAAQSQTNQHSRPVSSNSIGIGVFGMEELSAAAEDRKSGLSKQVNVPRQRRSQHSPADNSNFTGMDKLLDAARNTRSKSSRQNNAATGRTTPVVREWSAGLAFDGRSLTDEPSGRVDDEAQKASERLERRSARLELDEPQIADYRTERRPSTNKYNNRTRHTTRGIGYVVDDNELNDRPRKKKHAKQKSNVVDEKSRVHLPELISVENLGKALGVRFKEFVAQLEEMGFDAPRADHILDAETSALIAGEYNFEPIFPSKESTEDLVARPVPADASSLPRRPPIVTIMGHVDHGKTTILDWLRKTSVVESEHGGITQHIGAFAVTLPGTNERITFLDTPGHAAFLDMRRRGANVTDMVVLVVAADDSVKPQTLEAMKHAMEAKVDIIVAINKIDKEDANVDRVKQDLARHGLDVEDYGGNYQAIPVSGKTGKGMQELEEAIVLQASIQDYRAETDGQAEGWIIESKVTTAGRVATVLVRRGTMRPGDFIVAGTTWARIRTLRDDTGSFISEAPPGTPVQIDGWRGDDPAAGLEVLQADNEDQAKAVMDLRQRLAADAQLNKDAVVINTTRAEEAEARAKVLEWESQQPWSSKRRRRHPKDNEGWVEGAVSGGPQQVHFVIKADVAGSTEALVQAVSTLGSNEVAANVIRSGVGVVTESDIQHLAATGENGYVISFNQPVDGAMVQLAAAAGLKILDHNIIYKVTDDVTAKLVDELAPLITQKVLGEAAIGKMFEISLKKGTQKIAGCAVTNGTIARDKKIRVVRLGKTVYDGMLSSLKNIKKDVTEMRKGSECGMGFENWEDFQEGDLIQSYSEKSEKRYLL